MSSARGFGFNDETGEVVFYQVDEETGEPKQESQPQPACTVTVGSTTKPKNKKYTIFSKGITTKSKKFRSLKENIKAGSNPTSYRMLLIPTVLMIFPGFVCLCICLLESFLHIRCHRKNKHLKDPSMYYRSPFHAVTSTFCGICKASDSSVRIGHMQDQRKNRYDLVRGAL